MNNKRLSPTMAHTLDTIKERGGAIEVWRGGFWTYVGAEIARTDLQGYQIPSWCAGTQTIRALMDRGKLIPAAHSIRPGHMMTHAIVAEEA